MKSTYLIICILLLKGSQSLLIAQHYQTFFSDKEVYFANDIGDIECVRIDKIYGGEDSVFYSFPNMRQTGEECYIPAGPSWISKNIRIDDNGINYFYNKYGDTINIKTDAKLNEAWTVYRLPDSLYIQAKVIDYDLSEFLDQSDSVKTISFEAYDKSMMPISHPVENMSIQLSKHFGIVKTLNFSLFPSLIDEYGGSDDRQLGEYHLVGVSKPELGIQNLEWFDVFDFLPDDEIHVLNYYSCEGELEITKTIRKFLSRTDYTDSIVYDTEVEKSEYVSDSDPESYSKYFDRIVISQNTTFNKLPEEPILNADNSVWSYSMRIDEDFGITKTEPGYYGTYEPYSDTCWLPAYQIMDGWSASDKYHKGLGGPYYSSTPWPCLEEIKQSLEYFKKGDAEWGTPFNMTPLYASSHSLNPILIVPNPGRELITIDVSEQLSPYFLELYDLTGKIILQQSLSSGRNYIRISCSMTGLYLYRLIDKNGIVNGGKLAVD